MSEAIGEFSDAEIELCSRIMDLKFSDDLELYTGNKVAYGEIDDERPIRGYFTSKQTILQQSILQKKNLCIF